MTRISRYKLHAAVQKEMFDIFWFSLSHLKSSKDASLFFADLLSDTEEIMFAKRFAIALLLKRGKSPTQIALTLNVSFSMIRSVSEWVSRASKPMQELIEKIHKSQDIQSFIDSIESVLDKLPTISKGSWEPIKKAKWQREKDRSTRKQLT